MEKKKLYERPSVRKVRLEVKTAVLGTCNLSTDIIAKAGLLTCVVQQCFVT